MSRLDLFVTKPERYHRCVDASLQQTHGSRMSQHMQGHPLTRQGWTNSGGILDISCKSALKRISTEGAPALCWEQRITWLACALGQPGPQDGDSIRSQWCYPLLTPLAIATHMCAGAKMHIAAAQSDEFGCSKSGLDREAEQGHVAPPGPGRPIRRGQ